ncbi:SDR family NAD(P)-dependent oxidoreductase [Balneola sp. MJW-20]|uniref:SDR family NAD(P)-dependent oxidoreductase n=1 Tax=Gracilimonas aurantiaca TaxID=3234185 RepID=UPI003465B907
MSVFNNKNVLVTGGASGIGYLMGLKSLQRGARHLIIWDIDEKALNEVKKEFSDSGYSVSVQQVDVRNADSVKDAANRTREEHGSVNILFNNAGVVSGGNFADQSYSDIENTMNVNATGIMIVARAFIDDMISGGEGNIINIASAAGLTPNPGMCVYAASKWAATGWSESLRLEMDKNKTGVKVLTVMPSYIDTGMFKGVSPPLMMPFLDPEKITDKILRSVEKGKVRLREPWLVKITPFLRGVLPGPLYDFIAGKIFRVYDSMSTFKGRPDV